MSKLNMEYLPISCMQSSHEIIKGDTIILNIISNYSYNVHYHDSLPSIIMGIFQHLVLQMGCVLSTAYSMALAGQHYET